ncbi:hypothetical protein Ccrd_025426 [Cynara cardunculus var. scolymus]|uniref:Peptidase M41 n=1 Tax=Cynara cardunculus var. scolymus TaxID=59895 RepID=A0A103X823_CYNCS|nr:hypothetical protein Ccrd_025426 [Cynara cardunculus var. scolymus]
MNWSVGGPIGGKILSGFRRRIDGATVVATRRVKEDGDSCGVRRRRAALRLVDRQLEKSNFKLALSLVKQLQRQPPPAGLRGFAGARQVPRRVLSVQELHLSVTETSALQSLFDSILDLIMSSLESSPLEEGRSVTSEGDDSYLEDDIIEHKQVVQHEAGHFLVGYLLGVLPKKYSLFSMEDMKQDNIVDASVKFIGFEFLTKLEDGVLSKNLQVKPGHQLLCVIVGGLVAEHLVFGYSKGHHADVEMLFVDNLRRTAFRIVHFIKQLKRVLKQSTEDEANTLIRWCVLNTLVILHHHGEARSMLAEAMAHGRSIGNCIDIIENTLKDQHI